MIVAACLVSWSFLAQKDFTPGKRRSEVFGQADYKDYRPYGLQLSAGPTFMLTRKDNPSQTIMQNNRAIDYTIDPSGRPGVFIEAGMIHIPQKRSKLSRALKYIFVSYYDWGIGYKHLGGAESTHFDYKDPFGNIASSDDFESSFYNGFVYGRFTAHKNFYIGKKFFIDNGLGFNVDFNLVRANESSDYTGSVESVLGAGTHKFHQPFVAQLHYDLGLGYRINRRSMLIPGVQVPIMGINEWRGGCAALKWYDSNYLPLLVHIKWTYLFEKKAKACPPVKVNDQDKDTMDKQ